MNHVISLYLENLADASGGTVRPHITLAAYTDIIDVDGLAKGFFSYAGQCKPLTISYQSIGLFGVEESVLFFAPTVTHELLAIHERLHQHLSDFAEYADRYYTVKQWVPHSTMSLKVSLADLPAAIAALMQGASFPLGGAVAEIGLDEVTHDPLSVRSIATVPI